VTLIFTVGDDDELIGDELTVYPLE